jgi:CRP-like cAMP-binding protein
MNILPFKSIFYINGKTYSRKAKTSKDIINQKPEFRILAFLNAHKKGNVDQKELVPFTRQEIANFTGLRVETVIRAFAKMKAAKKIEIIIIKSISNVF